MLLVLHVMDVDLQAQYIDRSKQGEIIQSMFWELLQTYNDDKNNLPWWVVPTTTYRRRQLGRRIDILVQAEIQKRYNEFRSGSGRGESIA